MSLAKYRAAFTNAWQARFAYRVDTLVFFAIAAVSLIGTFYLWNDIFGPTAVIAGFSKRQIVTYFLLMDYLLIAMNPYLGVAGDINSGSISNMLTRPVSYLWVTYSMSWANKSVRLLAGLPFVLAICLIWRDSFYLVTDPWAYLRLALAVFGASNILFLLQLCIEMFEFWFKYADSLTVITEIVFKFLAGAFMPLAFMPEALQRFADALPFKYMGAFMLDAFFGRLDGAQFFRGFLIQCLWTAILALAANLIWRAGLKRYEAYGS